MAIMSNRIAIAIVRDRTTIMRECMAIMRDRKQCTATAWATTKQHCHQET